LDKFWESSLAYELSASVFSSRDAKCLCKAASKSAEKVRPENEALEHGLFASSVPGSSRNGSIKYIDSRLGKGRSSSLGAGDGDGGTTVESAPKVMDLRWKPAVGINRLGPFLGIVTRSLLMDCRQKDVPWTCASKGSLDSDFFGVAAVLRDSLEAEVESALKSFSHGRAFGGLAIAIRSGLHDV